MAAFRNLKDLTFGRLTVLGEGGRDKWGSAKWRCLCSCGTVVEKVGYHLTKKSTLSCGCLHREIVGAMNRSHALSKTPEYNIWCHMKSRCYVETDGHYKDYGARGIYVCEEWRESFETFFRDMGARPSPSHWIERADNDGNYEPKNCLWDTISHQANNKRTTKWVVYRGMKMSLADACRASNAPATPESVLSRLNTGWSLDDALTIPPKMVGPAGR